MTQSKSLTVLPWVMCSGEELGAVCEQACQRFTLAGYPLVSATAFAYEMVWLCPAHILQKITGISNKTL